MADWMDEEVRQAKRIIRQIDRFAARRRRPTRRAPMTIDLSQAEPLREELMEGGLFIRQLYRALNFDERQLFKWRMEHKLVQSLVLNHYAPGSMPVTRGLGAQVRRYGRENLRAKLHEHFPEGFWIKPALGYSSGDRGHSRGGGAETLVKVEAGELTPGHAARIADEVWVVQETIPIALEYRVHSLEDQVVDDLTFWRYENGDPPADEAGPVNAYVQTILDQLPAALVGHSLCGWDVALTERDSFLTVEVNLSGYHPVFESGFHCSGFFQDEEWGAKTIAHLVRFIEQTDGETITINSEVGEETDDSRFYAQIREWQQELALGSQA